MFDVEFWHSQCPPIKVSDNKPMPSYIVQEQQYCNMYKSLS